MLVSRGRQLLQQTVTDHMDIGLVGHPVEQGQRLQTHKDELLTLNDVDRQMLKASTGCHMTPECKKKGKCMFYTAKYPVCWTAKSGLHFPPLVDLFIPTPTRLLREAFQPGSNYVRTQVTHISTTVYINMAEADAECEMCYECSCDYQDFGHCNHIAFDIVSWGSCFGR